MVQVLDGKEVAARRLEQVKEVAVAFTSEISQAPTLAMLRVGEDPALVSHASAVQRAFEKADFGFQAHVLPEGNTLERLLVTLRDLNSDPHVHGVLIQEPLPSDINSAAVIESLNPLKDVDGVHPLNAGRLQQQRGRYHVPSTPLGGLAILDHYAIPLEGKRAVVIGRSDIVGKPMGLLLLHRNATVTLAHSRTRELAQQCREADILCAAVGRAGLVTEHFIKTGAVVVDFGINFVGGKLVGDVAYEEVSRVASAVTPTPGGTGPVTAVMLLENTLAAARWLNGVAGSRFQVNG